MTTLTSKKTMKNFAITTLVAAAIINPLTAVADSCCTLKVNELKQHAHHSIEASIMLSPIEVAPYKVKPLHNEYKRQHAHKIASELKLIPSEQSTGDYSGTNLKPNVEHVIFTFEF